MSRERHDRHEDKTKTMRSWRVTNRSDRPTRDRTARSRLEPTQGVRMNRCRGYMAVFVSWWIDRRVRCGSTPRTGRNPASTETTNIRIPPRMRINDPRPRGRNGVPAMTWTASAHGARSNLIHLAGWPSLGGGPHRGGRRIDQRASTRFPGGWESQDFGDGCGDQKIVHRQPAAWHMGAGRGVCREQLYRPNPR